MRGRAGADGEAAKALSRAIGAQEYSKRQRFKPRVKSICVICVICG
jgi:hypothetical protein